MNFFSRTNVALFEYQYRHFSSKFPPQSEYCHNVKPNIGFLVQNKNFTSASSANWICFCVHPCYGLVQICLMCASIASIRAFQLPLNKLSNEVKWTNMLFSAILHYRSQTLQNWPPYCLQSCNTRKAVAYSCVYCTN